MIINYNNNMTNKIIKNEQWYIKNLISKINNNEIYKPKYQRKRKWNTLPKKENIPNEKKYIEFLFETHNSVHAITFGINDGKYSNIDGNNRINSIVHFLNKPFELFSEYLIDINSFIDNNFENIDDINDIKDIFTSINYSDLMTFKYNKYFENIGKLELYNNCLKIKRDEFEPYIEALQKNLKINGEDRFDNNVQINVNLFEGYNTEELCKIFEDINKYNSKLTEMELLACSLYNITNFTINDNIVKVSIQDSLKEYYLKKADSENLICHEYNSDEKMNAYDFMVGYQNYANNQCKLIEESNNDGLSLFFKIYKTLYKGFDETFTTENINDFIGKINKSIEILQNILNNIFIDNLVGGGKIFEACNKKINTLRKNNLYLIIISIIGFINENRTDNYILSNITKCIVFHFIISDIKENKKIQKKFKDDHDCISYESGGATIDNHADKIYKNPILISDKITKDIMREAFDILLNENIKNKNYERRTDGRSKNDKRRSRKYFEKLLIFLYYKNKVPNEFLNKSYWIEHICPFSSSWENEIDIDRLGNIIPIQNELNCKRNNKHISEYEKYDEDNFISFIKEIIPSNDIYNKIISYESKRPNIYDDKLYNELCDNNEKIYVDNCIKYLFSY